jgi:DNA helicase II / ATP-dependent DNA helicase PcrA
LINVDAPIIRVKAGPGSGKTFGLARRVVRVHHPDGLDAPSEDCLVVAFNRVIAIDLRSSITEALQSAGIADREPTVMTVHALALKMLGEEVRLLLPHEVEAMLYDVRFRFPKIGDEHKNFNHLAQALRDVEAGHRKDRALSQAVEKWLARHNAALISEIPARIMTRLRGGDDEEIRYRHVMVDEYQDLTPIEQELVVMLRHNDGQLLSMGDPRQSIYAFRGNDVLGLDRLDEVALDMGVDVFDVPMVQCQRCPSAIVDCANAVMALSDEQAMVAASEVVGERHLVHWKTPKAEAQGMAAQIARHVSRTADDGERTLVMVTRRQFGYDLRAELRLEAPELPVDLTFSESILELWPVREAFLFLCLVADPDPPTWRGWLGYCNPDHDGRKYKSPNRNADAYLAFLKASDNRLTADAILLLADEPRSRRRGAGGSALWDRAKRFAELYAHRDWSSLAPRELLEAVFAPELWVDVSWECADVARADLQLLRDKAIETLDEDVAEEDQLTRTQRPLERVARDLRYRIATRTPFDANVGVPLQITTLWGAKGLTADHVYVIGLCDEALPGERAEEYPGDDEAFLDEQRRLFYVSITRPTKTLVLSRPKKVMPGLARRLGLRIRPIRNDRWVTLRTSQFLEDIIDLLPRSVPGEDWTGAGAL